MAIKHQFTSGKSDGSDTSVVQPSDWNADHDLNMGTGSGVAAPIGTADVNNTAVGTDADTTEKDLMTYDLPANSLSANGKGVRITAWGTTAANANNKTLKLYFGSVIISSGAIAMNNLDWQLTAVVFRTGASGQDYNSRFDRDSANPSIGVGTLTEDETSAITIKVTGQNGTASANDIVCAGILVEYIDNA